MEGDGMSENSPSKFQRDHAVNMAYQDKWFTLRTAISNERNIARREDIKAQLMELEAERHEALKDASPIYLAFLFLQEMRGIKRASKGVAGLPFRQKQIERWEDIEVFDLADLAIEKLSSFSLLERFQEVYEEWMRTIMKQEKP